MVHKHGSFCRAACQRHEHFWCKRPSPQPRAARRQSRGVWCGGLRHLCRTGQGREGRDHLPQQWHSGGSAPHDDFQKQQNIEQAKRFVDYVLSEEGQSIVANAFLLPARSDAAAKRPLLSSFKHFPPESDAQRAGRAALLERFDALFVRK